YAAAIVDLQGDEALAGTDLLIFYADHFFAVEPGGRLAALHFYLHLIPFPFLERLFFFCGGLYEPASAVRFINASGMLPGRRHFHLPAADLHPVDGGAEKDAAVAVGLLLELHLQDEIFV